MTLTQPGGGGVLPAQRVPSREGCAQEVSLAGPDPRTHGLGPAWPGQWGPELAGVPEASSR